MFSPEQVEVDGREYQVLRKKEKAAARAAFVSNKLGI
jgi:hypothetical protein